MLYSIYGGSTLLFSLPDINHPFTEPRPGLFLLYKLSFGSPKCTTHHHRGVAYARTHSCDFLRRRVAGFLDVAHQLRCVTTA